MQDSEVRRLKWQFLPVCTLSCANWVCDHWWLLSVCLIVVHSSFMCPCLWILTLILTLTPDKTARQLVLFFRLSSARSSRRILPKYSFWTKPEERRRDMDSRVAVLSLCYMTRKGPYTPDAIWQRDANFQFSITFNFNIFQCFSNIRNHLSNFSYLVCISCKIFIRWQFYLLLKTKNSRRVAESRPVCMDLNALYDAITR